MKERSATILGFVVASVIPPLALAALSVLAEVREHPMALSESALLAAVSFVVFYPYSLLFVAALGAPIFFIVRRLRLVTWWIALAAGALAGVLVAVIVRSGNEAYADVFLRFVPLATISAIAFWLVWKQGRKGSSVASTAPSTPPVNK